jgi:hydroxymethylpyrimidine/phosphomethylpyrimidine kinase
MTAAARPADGIPRVLTIAGSDSGGGAGIQAELKAFQELGVYGMTVLTALTAQNTVGVHAIHEVPASFVSAQLDAVATDIGTDAVKTGMLANASIVAAVADGVRAHRLGPLVVDPVCASKHGDPLLRPDAVDALRRQLLPLADLVTPNLGEVRLLTGVEVGGLDDLPRAARAVKALGPRWVLIKAGHLPGNSDATDLLFDGETEVRVTATRVETDDTHGTGDTLAAAITAQLALGSDMLAAVRSGKAFVTGAIRHALRLGKGIGPVDQGWGRRRQAPAVP